MVYITKRIFNKNGTYTDYRQQNIYTGKTYKYVNEKKAMQIVMEMNECGLNRDYNTKQEKADDNGRAYFYIEKIIK